MNTLNSGTFCNKYCNIWSNIWMSEYPECSTLCWHFSSLLTFSYMYPCIFLPHSDDSGELQIHSKFVVFWEYWHRRALDSLSQVSVSTRLPFFQTFWGKGIHAYLSQNKLSMTPSHAVFIAGVLPNPYLFFCQRKLQCSRNR